jgi:hypothetical protein
MMRKFFTFLILLVLTVGVSAQISIFSRTTDGRLQQPAQTKIIKSYPNPATSFITFEFQRSYNIGYSIEVYNLPGKRVALASNISNKTTLQLQNFYRGVYMYKLVDRTGKVIESGKFQVVK